ncbi:MAG: homoserine dehydrogenase [Verrucomicrobiota bacterium]
MKQFRIALVGLGTVGGGVWRHLHANLAQLKLRTGAEISVTRTVARRPERAAELGVPAELNRTDWREVVADPEVDCVVELIGGTSDACELVTAALGNGKHVVTANKALLAEHGHRLFALAQEKGLQLLFEASVAGGIPYIKAQREGLIANRLREIYGIVNGTCNYILDRMLTHEIDYATALTDAKQAGYAEADESLDVDGHDSAHKAAIIAALAYGFWVPGRELFTEGIRGIARQDLVTARTLGYEVKLLAVIKCAEDQQVEVRVHPTLIPKDHPLAAVDSVYNGLFTVGDIVGNTMFYGMGAGADPTASAVLADIAEIACHFPESRAWQPITDESTAHRLKPMDDIVSRYYLRLSVIDRPGVMATLCEVFGRRGIGLSSIHQDESEEGGTATLIFMVHDACERTFAAALDEIAQLDLVQAPPVRLRVEDLP